MWRGLGNVALMLGCAMLVVGCGAATEEPVVPAAEDSPLLPTEDPDPGEPAPTRSPVVSFVDQGLESLGGEVLAPWSGDLDGMVERRVIRFLLVFNKMGYFLDGGRQRGVTYEATRLLEEFINERLGTDIAGRVHVLVIPVRRDQLLPMVREGLGDIAASNLTITDSRLEEVDFTSPLYSGVREVVVTGPAAPAFRGFEDLAGSEVHVRRSSSYFESLQRLNEDFASRGLEPVTITPVDEYLEDEDILEMVNAGLLPWAVVDEHKAVFWADIFDSLTVRTELAVSSGNDLGWAFRKQSPQFAALLDDFVAENRQGTLMGNILIKRYLQENKWARNSLTEESMERLRTTREFFERYAGEYDFDWLMIAAQSFQESGLDQNARSGAGAIGIMQLLKSTASDPNVGIPDIEQLEQNIHAGVKYLRFMTDHYFKDSGMDELNKALFAFASYNAGPNRVARMRRKAAELGLDPDLWFANVELVAAQEIGRETVEYVDNIYQYWIAYKLVVERNAAVGRAQAQ